nr:cation channel sperm-associated protein 1 isoform X1 [Microcebus murinus]
MDQTSMSEKAQNEADTNNLDMFSQPLSSSPHHRPGHSGAHRRHRSPHYGMAHDHSESDHYGTPHHHGGSHHSREFQDLHDNPSQSQHHGRAYSPTALGPAAAHDIVSPHPAFGEDYFNDEHHYGSRMHHSGAQHAGSHQGRSHHHSRPSHYGRSHRHGQPPSQGGPKPLDENLSQFFDGGSSQHNGSNNLRKTSHPDELLHNQSRQREARHQGRPLQDEENASHLSFEGASHQGLPRQQTKHDDGDRRPSEQQDGEHPHHRGHRHGEHSHHRGHRHGDHHHRREHRHSESQRSSHQFDDNDRQLKPVLSKGSRPRVASQLSTPHETRSLIVPHTLTSAISLMTPPQRGGASPGSAASSVTQALTSMGSQLSSKVYPKDFSSKVSETWDTEDEQFQKRKTGRSQRAHKKTHTWNLLQWLWEKLSYFIQQFRKMIWDLTHSLVFEFFIFFIICLNTIMLVVQTFAQVEIRGEWYFTVLDAIFFSIYLLEALLKIIALGFSYFRDVWNNLDFFIVIVAMLDFTLLQLYSFSMYQLSVFRILKVLKSLRALRAIRVLRKLSILTSLHEMTGTLAQTFSSIAAILILMFTCLFLFSVVLRALFRKSDPKRFQSIFSTIFTLFTMLTLDDWSLIYMDSRAQGAWYIIPILMIYIIIQYFIFLNLVIAVLVDNFQMALLKGLEKLQQEKAAQNQEKLLEDSLTELKQEHGDELSDSAMKKLLEKKFGAMTKKQQELLFHYLQLVAGVENQQQKFRSQAFIIDEIVDVTFEAGDEDFGR